MATLYLINDDSGAPVIEEVHGRDAGDYYIVQHWPRSGNTIWKYTLDNKDCLPIRSLSRATATQIYRSNLVEGIANLTMELERRQRNLAALEALL